MPDYKKLYAYLLGEMDKALTLLEKDNILDARKIMLHAVEEAEEMIISDETY